MNAYREEREKYQLTGEMQGTEIARLEQNQQDLQVQRKVSGLSNMQFRDMTERVDNIQL